MMNELIPVIVEKVGDQTIQTVNLRDLHEALGVGRDFSTWAKERIAKFDFTEGQDFVITQDLISPVSGSSKARNRETVEYHASLDMAKELAMVENNEKGRAVRRYFIAVEKQFKAQVLPDLSDPLVLQQLLSDHVRGRIAAERRADEAEQAVLAAKPKTEFYDKFANADGRYTLQNAGRVLGLGPNKFIQSLKAGYLFYQGGNLVPKAYYRDMGVFEVKATVVDDAARYQTFVTPKGLQYLSEKLGIGQLPV